MANPAGALILYDFQGKAPYDIPWSIVWVKFLHGVLRRSQWINIPEGIPMFISMEWHVQYSTGYPTEDSPMVYAMGYISWGKMIPWDTP